MIPLPVLFEVFELAFGTRDWRLSAATATEKSIARISGELKIEIPRDFAALSQNCASHGNWFSSIGEDYGTPNHILQANKSMRVGNKSYNALPSHLIVLNHGFDGDCDCWDTQRAPNENGEFSIVYYEASSGKIRNPNYDFPSFVSYLEYLCRAKVKNATSQEERHKKMRNLLAPYELDTKRTT